MFYASFLDALKYIFVWMNVNLDVYLLLKVSG